MRLLSPEVCMIGYLTCGTAKPAARGRRASPICFLRRWMLVGRSAECAPGRCSAAAVCKNVAFVCINAGAACENAGGVLMVGALRAGMDAGPGVTFRGCRRHASRCGCRRACDGSGPVVAGRSYRCKGGVCL